MFVGVPLTVSSQEVVPFGLELCTARGRVAVDLVGLIGNMEALVGRETELGLQRRDIIGL